MKNDPYFPNWMDQNTRDIINRFLDKNPETRLQKPEEIRSHPFFQGINWDALSKLEVTPPFVPAVKNKESTQNIDKNFINMDLKKVLIEETPILDDSFENFTYARGQSKGKNDKKTEQNNNS